MIDNKILIEELNTEILLAEGWPEDYISWDDGIGILLTTHKMKQIISQLQETMQLNILVIRDSCDMITEEYVYKKDFRFQRTQRHGVWFVTYQNHLITFGQYRHDLEQWIDSNYA